MRRQIILPMFVLALGLVGCGGHVPNPVTSSSGVNLGGQGVAVDIWASDQCVQRGDTVALRATVTNKTSKTQIFELKDRPVLDLAVKAGGVTSQWSDGKTLTSDLTRLELLPGQSKTIGMDWRASYSGTVGARAIFYFDAEGPPLAPGVLISVGSCPGVLGP